MPKPQAMAYLSAYAHVRGTNRGAPRRCLPSNKAVCEPVTPPRSPAKTSTCRQQAGDDLMDWTVIGLIVVGSALIVWVPFFI